MVRDNALSPIRFLELIESHSGNEPDSAVLQTHLNQKATMVKAWYLTDENRKLWSERLFNLAIKNLEKEQDDQFQMSWFNLLHTSAESDNAIEYMNSILDGETAYANLEIDQEKRWKIVTKLCSFD